MPRQVRQNERERALDLLKKALDDIARDADIKDISVYPETDHYEWRHWAGRGGNPIDPAKQPSTAWAIFREDLPHDVLLRIQANFFAGASWTEISLLPICLLFRKAWKFRLSQKDAGRLFNIKSQIEYEEAVDAFTFKQLRNFLLLLPIALYDTWDDPFNLSIEGFIEQVLRPHFRKRWRALGIPTKMILFPEVRKEIEEHDSRRKKFRNDWIRKTHGGFRTENQSFADKQDFPRISEFISKAHPLWKYVTEFFAQHEYDESCIEWVRGKAKFKELSSSIAVPHKLLRKVFRRKSKTSEELEPLGFAIEHAREAFKFEESRSTVRRHYRSGRHRRLNS